MSRRIIVDKNRRHRDKRASYLTCGLLCKGLSDSCSMDYKRWEHCKYYLPVESIIITTQNMMTTKHAQSSKNHCSQHSSLREASSISTTAVPTALESHSCPLSRSQIDVHMIQSHLHRTSSLNVCSSYIKQDILLPIQSPQIHAVRNKEQLSRYWDDCPKYWKVHPFEEVERTWREERG
jgi:hypothetical protein